jgi:phosphoribosyl-AMP cyclohydrolase / phosphoribosyl-ATP pyrophosphohydrolase
MKIEDIGRLDWDKGGGLLPAIVQDAANGRVLMLGYMNREALRATLGTRRVTFYSRSRESLWTKGETSGNFLELVEASMDCDRDTLLLLARPAGPVCHEGTPTCFPAAGETGTGRLAFLQRLEQIIASRVAGRPEGSYTARLFAQGPARIAQKVGEEGVELALAAVGSEDAKVVGEAADLLYHVMILLRHRGLTLADIAAELELRHASRTATSAPAD